jgi:predicted metal-dependent phosphoesterase TrpH
MERVAEASMNPVDEKESHHLEICGHISLTDKETCDYRSLFFEVPSGTNRIEVEYAFSEDEPGGLWREAGNIVDIGLFDAHGSEFLTEKGFRGWSGSARRRFFIAEDEATPGYLPGPLPAGRWQILLGLHRILPQGCDYRVTIGMYPGEETEKRASDTTPASILRHEAGWYRGDLHCHTHHSDAKGSLEDLVATARMQKLDFLAVTEHNTVSHLPFLPQYTRKDLLLISGEEITTDYGHANVWGIDRWQEFRCRSQGEMRQVVEQARAQGALVSINHPKEIGPPWTFGMEEEFDCIEVWQLAWFMFNEQALALWDRLLREGHRLTAVGGSDYHQEPFTGELGVLSLGTPCTWVFAQELSQAGILAGIRAGQVFISKSPEGPRIELSAEAEGQVAGMGDDLIISPGSEVHMRCRVEGSMGDRLLIRSPQAVFDTEIEAEAYEHAWTQRAEEDTFIRAEVVREGAEMHALSNPIYLRLRRDEHSS